MSLLTRGTLRACTPLTEQQALDARSLQGGSDLVWREPALRPLSCQHDTGGERAQQPPQALHRPRPSIRKRRVPRSSAAISASAWNHQTEKAWFIGWGAYARRGPSAASRAVSTTLLRPTEGGRRVYARFSSASDYCKPLLTGRFSGYW